MYNIAVFEGFAVCKFIDCAKDCDGKDNAKNDDNHFLFLLLVHKCITFC